jgi:PBSX family phage terminase large subunit
MTATAPFVYGKFSDKAKKTIKESNARINIWHGAVRSSKTINASIRFITHMGQFPKGTNFLLTGKTERTVKRNIIDDLEKMVYPRECKYNRYDGELKILGQTVYVVGLKDEGATDKIKGMTVAGWLGDEVTTCPQSSIEMAISRCSIEGAKIFWTTNPDSPYHFIYTDYVDNDDLKEAGIVKEWGFLLEDNPNLPKEYIDSLKRASKGVFYKRNILGQWVLAEGAIYDMFLESENTFKHSPIIKRNDLGNIIHGYTNYVVGIDYATSTVCVFGLFGLIEINGEMNYHLLKEWYYDAEDKGVQMDDGEYADKMVEFIGDCPVNRVYSPHDATSLTVALRKKGLPVITYMPDTINDIKKIQVIMNERRFQIHESCVNSIAQAQTYVWDPQKAKKQIEFPLKKDDHCPDMWRGPICGAVVGNAYGSSGRYDLYENNGNKDIYNRRRGH